MTFKILVVLFLSAIGSTAGLRYLRGETCDVASASDRIDCGYRGISKRTCLSRGCCWDTAVRGVPWCFHRTPLKHTMTTSKPEPDCDVGRPGDRADCGYPGIDRQTCREKGCCWNTDVPGVPSCFYAADAAMAHGLNPESEPQCDVYPSERLGLDCGYPGISRDTCRQRGCCWDTSVRGVPWCFYGKNTFDVFAMYLPDYYHYGDYDVEAGGNECATDNGGCPEHSKCINTPSSYYCSCDYGYKAYSSQCVDVDECATLDFWCPEHSACQNTPGSYQCVCDYGYMARGSQCVVKPCEPGEIRCWPLTCISACVACDGYSDCRDDYDEDPEFCATWECPAGFERCSGSRQCVRDYLFCNGVNDCALGSDEDDAFCATRTCPKGYALCYGSRQCVLDYYFDDGYNDCNIGTDELADFLAWKASRTETETADVAMEFRARHPELNAWNAPTTEATDVTVEAIAQHAKHSAWNATTTEAIDHTVEATTQHAKSNAWNAPTTEGTGVTVEAIAQHAKRNAWNATTTEATDVTVEAITQHPKSNATDLVTMATNESATGQG